MNSTPSPKAIEPDDVLVARADQRLAHAYAQIARADEQIARVNEQISKLDQGAAPDPSAVLSRRPARRGSLLRGLIGLLLAAGIFLAAFFSQSPYGDAARLMIAGWTPQRLLTSPLPPEGFGAQTSPSPVQLAAAEPAAAQSIAASPTAPQDVTPTAAPMAPELAQLLQTMARDLANAQQGIEQLKASQEQAARENARAIEELKAGQEQMTRLMAKATEKASEKVSEPKASGPNRTATPAPPKPVAAPARKPPTHPSPQARAVPRPPTQLQPQVQ
jgi:DNA-binding protein H-NS